MLLSKPPGPRRPAIQPALAGLLLVFAVAAGLIPRQVTAGDAPELKVEWRLSQVGDEPAPVAAEAAAGWSRADPTRLHTFPRGSGGAWVRITAEPAWPADDWRLLVLNPGMERFTVFRQGAEPPFSVGMTQLDRSQWLGHGRIALAAPRQGQAPLLLRIEHQAGVSPPMAFQLLPLDGFLQQDARWLAFASACLGIMAAMAVVALIFSLLLRDLTFLIYAGYLLTYIGIQLQQSGYGFHPLQLEWLAESPRFWGRLCTASSVVLATLFLDRFANLRRHAPRWRLPVLAFGAAVALAMLLVAVPLDPVSQLGVALVNPLLILGGPLLLAAALRAWWCGSRYGGFFALGWTPLLLFTVLGSAQLFGVFVDQLWIDDAGLAAAAFESLLLSLGLADRTLGARRERDRARLLAETDPLTGLLNRRAFAERLQQRLDAAAHRSVSLLFIDLDKFKPLNDEQGHAAGDHALQRVAKLLHDRLGVDDLVARQGGDEFVVMLADCVAATARTRAELICRDVAELGLSSSAGLVTVSIGVTQGRDGDLVENLLERADQALYAAKAAGRNRVHAV